MNRPLLALVTAGVLLAPVVAQRASAQTRSATWINVFDAGAKPDDATDSTAAIQNAIFSAGQGGRIYLPADQNRPGAGASAVAVVSNGAVTSINSLKGGNGYTRPPYVTFVGGGCRGVTGHTALSGTTVSAVVIDGKGTGCATAPSIVFIPASRCYLVSQIELLSATMLGGDGELTCIRALNSGQNPVITNKPVPLPARFGVIDFEVPASIVLSDFSLMGDGATSERGIRLYTNGSGSQNTTNALIQHVWVRGFTISGISLSQTYGTTLINVRSDNNGAGLLLEGDATHFTPLIGQAFNGSTTVIGGDYSLNTTGVYLDDWATEFTLRGAVLESNRACGLQVKAPYHGVTIDTTHFENNALKTPCEDIAIQDSGAYDSFGSGLSIRNNVFVDPVRETLLASMLIAGSYRPEVSGNTNESVPAPGCPGTGNLCGLNTSPNRIIIATGTMEPDSSSNFGFDLQNEAASPLLTNSGNLRENAFAGTSDLTRSIWNHTVPIFRDDGTCGGCSSADLLPASVPTWQIPLAQASFSMPVGVSQMIGPHPGSYVSAGFWLRMNSGTGTAFITIRSEKANYTGSTLNQPIRSMIDSHWRWISAGIALPASDTTPVTIGVLLYRNNGSSAAYANLAYPQAAIDIVDGMPGYIETADGPLLRQIR